MHDAMMKCLFSEKDKKNEIVHAILFIDPGINGTGYAFYPIVDAGYTDKYYPPTITGTFHPKKSSRWDGKVEVVCSWFDGFIQGIRPKILVIEYPEIWDRSAVSTAAAMRGDLFKLTFLIGGLSEVGRRHGCNLPLLIHPQKWKGQLPKEVIQLRIKKLIPEKLIKDEHCADAIAMGLAAQNVL